ncbi:SDR family oxidoreductase [Hymenobacter sp. YC55]|uniref:SDR family oxidoreductase n=1 Tax=Hymenobacter sp. YC55 TaxID=3034019 RepID=UPI0023F840E9|nr:SDR family oxidoreductase [Hymenobacter sp. YC55]MDF7814048.1 SDR family oxidoreductase [Hymenobacter sp. YC55]
MKKLTSKVALITGGTTGIGLATAKEFAEQGAQVIITGRQQNTVDEAVRQVGSQVLGLVSDTSKLSQVELLQAQVKELTPHLDILFINAGIALLGPISDVTPASFDATMNTNFKGAYFTIQALLPLLRPGGSIILNTSINAHIGMAGASAYAASKAALLSLARNLSAELIPQKIRVNAISPGPIATPLHSTEKFGITNEQLQQMGDGIRSQIPLGRFGTPEEIAKAALFLASSDSSFMLGAEMIIDGGMATL